MTDSTFWLIGCLITWALLGAILVVASFILEKLDNLYVNIVIAEECIKGKNIHVSTNEYVTLVDENNK